LKHDGETVGPRPELTQEMMQAAGVRFYMYTTQRFLEFAQQFFSLKPEPTKKATSEIKEIEEQDRQAATRVINAWVGEAAPSNPPTWFSGPVTYGRAVGGQPEANTFIGSWQPEASTFIDFPTFKTVSPEEEAAKNKYLQLLPINGQVFNSSAGEWKCEITSAPSPGATDRACYQLKFEPADRIRGPKQLALWVSVAGLHHDSDWRYKKAIFRIISDWLGSGQSSGEVAYFA